MNEKGFDNKMKSVGYFCLFVLIFFLSCSESKSGGNQKIAEMQNSKTPGINYPKVKIETNYGNMIMELRPDVAPKHVANFLKLVNANFYDGTTFHRVIPNFMIQGGDPNSKSDNRLTHGIGGPGYTIPAEINLNNLRGSVAAARLGDEVNPNRESSGSQFYINILNNLFLDDQYSVFGQIIVGMDVADKIALVQRDDRDNPIEQISMKITVWEK